MVNWNAIDTVLLDMDGTLLDLNFDNQFWLDYLPRRYSELRGVPLAEARALEQELSDSLHGHLLWYCIDHWSEALGVDVLSLKREMAHLVRLRADSAAFLQFLRDSGKRSVLVTNAHPKALAFKLQASGLEQHPFDARYSSHRFGLAKENPGFWDSLRAAGDFDYARCLFIDDSPSVLRRAQAEGPAQVLQVLQPDSALPPQQAEEFQGFIQFAELMP
ncbi:MAG: GMP/IMP nucleotidase [Pseudomonadales bacterium]|jgi:putative hydrolase of the HAD superfamily|nr:GMP/IMP nucleotidase [Pseudomonadales bacterium]